MTCFHQLTVLVRDFRNGQRFNNRIQKSWWKVIRSLVLKASSFKTTRNTKICYPRRKTFSSIQNKHVLKKLKTNDPQYHFKLESLETPENRTEKLQCTSTSFQIMMRGIWGVKDWQNHHSEQKQPSTKIIESHQTRLRLVGSDARQRPTFLEREVLIWLASINRKFLSGTLAMARDSTTEFRNLGGKSSGV